MTAQSTPSSNKSRRFEILVYAVVALLVFLNLGETITRFQDVITRDTWLTTQATVVKTNSKTHWLSYQYTVDEQTYLGTRLSITQDAKSDINIPQIVEDFPEGKQITIHYAPHNPARSTISLDADFTYLLGVILFIPIMLIVYAIAKILFRHYLGWVKSMLLIGNKHHD